jgi:hypothetical protein
MMVTRITRQSASKKILALMARVSTLKPMESPFTTDPETGGLRLKEDAK